MPLLPISRPHRLGRSLLVACSALVLLFAVVVAVASRDDGAAAVDAGGSSKTSVVAAGSGRTEFRRTATTGRRHWNRSRRDTSITAPGTVTSTTGPTANQADGATTAVPPTTAEGNSSSGGDASGTGDNTGTTFASSTTAVALPSPGTGGATTTTSRSTTLSSVQSTGTTAQPTTTTARATSTTARATTTTAQPTTTTARATTVLSGGTPLNCAAVPSQCGYPDATNTGPAAGTSFVAVPSQVRSGSGWEWSDALDGVRVFGTGAVLNGLNVSGPIIIDAPNVTVSNSIVSACGGDWDGDVIAIRYKASDSSYRGSGARVIRNRLNGSPAGCTHRARSGVRDIYGEAIGLYVDGNDISGTGNGITTEYEATVVNNWVHDLGHLAGDHHSGISTHGGGRQIVFQHNTVLLHGQKFAGGGGVSGAITIYADFGHAQNTTVQDNLISGGSYVVYGGNSGDGYSTPSTNIKFISNRFRCGDWLYGPVTAFNASSSGNQWTGNFCDQTGQAVNS